ncbi:MAG TPA: Spy/CpxP family protein refolding chaperone [Acidobacteriota bacterium]
MKKILLIAIPVVIVVVALVALPSFGSGSLHRHHGMMKDFLFYKIDKLGEDLNLNPAQQAKWDTFKNDLGREIEQRRDKRKEIHNLAKQELEKDNPDFTKITPLVHGQIDSTAQFAHDMVNRINELLSDLTPEQKQKIAQEIQEMHDHHD